MKHYHIKKVTSPTLGAGLDLIFFIVQLDATGPSKYTFMIKGEVKQQRDLLILL